MTNKDFDNLLKEKLEGLQTEAMPKWDKMSAHINSWNAESPILSDEEFDHTVREKLEESRSIPTTVAWERFRDYLYTRRAAHKQVLFYQLSGAAILALLLLALYQIYPINRYDEVFIAQSINSPSGQSIILPLNKDSEKEENIEEIVFADNDGLNFDQNDSSQGEIAENIKSYTTIIAIDDELGSDNSFAEINTDIVEVTDQAIVAIEEVENDEVYPRSIAQDMIKWDKAERLSSSKVLSIQSSDRKISQIDLKPIIVTPIEKKNSLDFALMLASSTNYILSPYNETNRGSGYDRLVQDIGFGIRMSYRQKDFSLNSGLSYQAFNYEPKLSEEYVEEDKSYVHLNKIGFKFLYLPLNLHYHFYKNGPVQLYALSGLTAGLLLDANYDIQKRQNGLISLIDDLRTNPNYQNLYIAQKEYEEGVVAGGKTANNILLTADLGLGIEYDLNSDITLFAEGIGQYNFANKGFGPNDDQINRFSVLGGIKIALN